MLPNKKLKKMNEKNYIYRCDCHLKHEQKLNDHEKHIDENKIQNQVLWETVRGYVTIKIFIWVVGILFLFISSSITLQVSILTKTVAVATKLEAHVQHTKNNGHSSGGYNP
jgi:hypothetical protein